MSLVQTPVGDCMNTTVVTIDQYASLAVAYEKMQTHKIRRLPVLKHENLVGIITLTDILDAKPSDIKHNLNVERVNEYLSLIIVETAMKRNPLVIYQTDTIGHAAEMMLNEKIGGLPVLDANKELVGMITESDIFSLIVRKWRDENLLTFYKPA